MLSAVALVVAISDPDAGQSVSPRYLVLIAGALALASILWFVDSSQLVGLAYLRPVALLVTVTLPVTITRVLHHRQVSHETVLGALCAYVLIGLLFAFLFLAVSELRSGPFFVQSGEHAQSEYVYFSFVTLTTLGFGDLSPSVAPAGVDGTRGLARTGVPRDVGRPPRHALGTVKPSGRSTRRLASSRTIRVRDRGGQRR